MQQSSNLLKLPVERGMSHTLTLIHGSQNHLCESFPVNTGKIQGFFEKTVSEGAQHGPHHSKRQLPDSAPVLRLNVVGVTLGTRLSLERLLETEKIRLTGSPTHLKQLLWLSGLLNSL